MKTPKAVIIRAVILTCLSCNKKAPCTENQRDSSICTAIYEPVCGCNTKTYGNACEAEAHGIKLYTAGECKPENTTAAPL